MTKLLNDEASVVVSEEDADELFDAGLNARQSGNDILATQLWLRAAKKANAENAKKIADGLSAIASTHHRADRFDEAERLYNNALELRIQFLSESDKSTGMELNNLAMLYDRRGDKERAIEYLEKCVAILDKHSDLVEYRFGVPYDNLASSLFEDGDLVRAEVLSRRSLEIYDQLLGKINPLSLKSLELLANIQATENPHSRGARELRKEFKARLPLLAQAYDKLGDSMLSQSLFIKSQIGAHDGDFLVSKSLDTLCLNLLR